MSKTGERGKWGEACAEAYLVTNGYGILERNWRMGHYELDLVAQKDGYIVFVEVKTRKAGQQDPVEAVNTRKRARMVTAADVYMRRYDIPLEYRFDIIAIVGDELNHTIEHIPDAFVPSLKRINYSFRL